MNSKNEPESASARENMKLVDEILNIFCIVSGLFLFIWVNDDIVNIIISPLLPDTVLPSAALGNVHVVLAVFLLIILMNHF